MNTLSAPNLLPSNVKIEFDKVHGIIHVSKRVRGQVFHLSRHFEPYRDVYCPLCYTKNAKDIVTVYHGVFLGTRSMNKCGRCSHEFTDRECSLVQINKINKWEERQQENIIEMINILSEYLGKGITIE